jgi:hypothetical protein
MITFYKVLAKPQLHFFLSPLSTWNKFSDKVTEIKTKDLEKIKQ